MKAGWPRFQEHDILAQRLPAPLSRAVGALGWGTLDHHAPRRPRMTVQAKLLFAVAISGFAALAATSSAQALTTQECSAKYQAAKAAGTLGAQKWNDFRKAQCAADAAAAPAAAPRGAPAARPRSPEARGSQAQEGSHACRGARRPGRACCIPHCR